MKNSFLKFFLALCWIAASASALQKKQFECEPYPYSRVALKHREHKGVGWDKGYTTLSLFLAPRNNHVLVPFLDARFHAFNNGYIASNLGVGARFAPISDNFVVGLNTYYDFREYKSFSSHQASAGIEFLTSVFDVRVNGYYPFSGKTEEKDVYFHQFRKNSAYLRQDILYSLPSADAEIGFELPEPMKQVQLYLAFGSYYLFKTHANNHSIGNAIGYKARLTATPEDYISFGVEYTHDRLFNNRVNGYISFQVPLGKKKAKTKSKHKYYKHRNECDSYYTGMRRKTQDPYHNEIIPFYDETHTFNADRVTSSPNHFIFVNNTNLDPQEIGSGSGTFEDPYTTLKLGELNSVPGDIIYVFYGRGNDDGYNKGFIFKNNQALTGSGVDLEIKGFFVPAFTPDELPVVSNRLNMSSSTMTASNLDNFLLQGFDISSKNASAISLENTGGTIQLNKVSSPSSFPCLSHKDPSESFILFNQFNNTANVEGINQQARKYFIEGNKFLISSGVGLTLSNPAESLLIANNEIISSASSSLGISYTRNSNSSLTITTIYRNNSFIQVWQGIDHTFSTPGNESVSFINNNFINNQFGVKYSSASMLGNVSFLENSFVNNIFSLLAEFQGQSNITTYIEKNTFSGIKNTGVYLTTFSQGELFLQNNKINALNGVSLDNKCYNYNLYSFSILNNEISFADFGVLLNNSDKGSSYGKIEQNTFACAGGLKTGVSLNATGKGNICTSFTDNRGTNQPVITTSNIPSENSINFICRPPLNNASLLAQNPGFSNIFSTAGFFSISADSCPKYLPIIYVNNTNTNPNPDGSKNNPWPTLLQAQNASNANDIIYVYPGDGTTKGYDQGIILKDGQTLGSPAVTFEVDGIVFPSDGSNPPKITSSTGAVISAADSSLITGFNIIPNLNVNGIVSQTGADHLQIISNTFLITGDNDAAIILSGNTFTIEKNNITINGSSSGIKGSITGNFANINIDQNNFLENSGSVGAETFAVYLNASSTIGNTNVQYTNNSCATTNKPFALYSSPSSINIDIHDCSFGGKAGLALIGPSTLVFTGNTLGYAQGSYGQGTSITNTAKTKINNFSGNLFIGAPGQDSVGADFVVNDTLCISDLTGNRAQNTGFVFFFSGFCTFEGGSPSFSPDVNFLQTASVIESNNFLFRLLISPQSHLNIVYDTPCP